MLWEEGVGKIGGGKVMGLWGEMKYVYGTGAYSRDG